MSKPTLLNPQIRSYPLMPAYAATLEALADSCPDGPTPEVENKVVAVLTMWAEGVARGALKVGGTLGSRRWVLTAAQLAARSCGAPACCGQVCRAGGSG